MNKKHICKKKELSLEDRFNGSLFGLFIGDALGAPLEFQSSGQFEEITDYSYGGVHNCLIGQWTDDSSMALCLMDSLQEKGFDLKDQFNKYILWMRNGEYSSIGRCFDIGSTISQALTRHLPPEVVYRGIEENAASGNGSIMRLAPVPIFFFKEGFDSVLFHSVESSRVTHQSKICLDSVGYFSSILYSIFNGEKDKEKIIKNDLYIPIDEDVIFIKNADYNSIVKYDLNPSGYVVDSIYCALYCFNKTKDFKSAVLMAANLGGDSDTIAAITGQIAGAYYGYSSIPTHLVDRLMKIDYLKNLTDKFLCSF